ncbi:MAG: hypothetical protein H7Z74_13640 [Anaerolineae bacterium]|nr:hypothetical protein [Gemmatimonadaceae bacterium]
MRIAHGEWGWLIADGIGRGFAFATSRPLLSHAISYQLHAFGIRYQLSAIRQPPAASRAMYSTCLFCHASLGENDVIELFPIGRRLAFDSNTGRLWVVCRRCERWNLTPLEERWEAIEDCERRFRDTRLRVSTDNIGLAQLREGLQLVRVGKPQRPEFAAWRYGDQFGRRRRTRVIQVGAGLGALGALVAGGVALGVGAGGFGYMIVQLSRRIVTGNPEGVVARLETRDQARIEVRRKDLDTLRLSAEADSNEWSLHLRNKSGLTGFTGEDAVHAMGLLLPALNRFGGSQEKVTEAVTRIEAIGDSDAYLLQSAKRAGGRDRLADASKQDKITDLALEERLALEMAVHEQTERRALEGEIKDLERDWREAEEIAAIADNLLLPAGFDEFLRKYRRGK